MRVEVHFDFEVVERAKELSDVFCCWVLERAWLRCLAGLWLESGDEVADAGLLVVGGRCLHWWWSWIADDGDRLVRHTSFA